VQRRGPVRAPLEDGELLRLLGDLGDGLNGGRSGADDADAFASEVHRRVRPARRVIGGAEEAIPPGNGGEGVGGQDADGGAQEARLRLLAAFQGHSPLVRDVIPVRGRDCAAELHVPTEVELVSDMVQVF
jgi:hypothetical protein